MKLKPVVSPYGEQGAEQSGPNYPPKGPRSERNYNTHYINLDVKAKCELEKKAGATRIPEKYGAMSNGQAPRTRPAGKRSRRSVSFKQGQLKKVNGGARLPEPTGMERLESAAERQTRSVEKRGTTLGPRNAINELNDHISGENININGIKPPESFLLSAPSVTNGINSHTIKEGPLAAFGDSLRLAMGTRSSYPQSLFFSSSFEPCTNSDEILVARSPTLKLGDLLWRQTNYGTEREGYLDATSAPLHSLQSPFMSSSGASLAEDYFNTPRHNGFPNPNTPLLEPARGMSGIWSASYLRQSPIITPQNQEEMVWSPFSKPGKTPVRSSSVTGSRFFPSPATPTFRARHSFNNTEWEHSSSIERTGERSDGRFTAPIYEGKSYTEGSSPLYPGYVLLDTHLEEMSYLMRALDTPMEMPIERSMKSLRITEKGLQGVDELCFPVSPPDTIKPSSIKKRKQTPSPKLVRTPSFSLQPTRLIVSDQPSADTYCLNTKHTTVKVSFPKHCRVPNQKSQSEAPEPRPEGFSSTFYRKADNGFMFVQELQPRLSFKKVANSKKKYDFTTCVRVKLSFPTRGSKVSVASQVLLDVNKIGGKIANIKPLKRAGTFGTRKAA
ncbi:hypothetical protein BABINDRAFT_131611 [Babjeviella inositovora NRRL Y-12698]|uniref:Uncharacterized protein n=1 Tax=Babjeviella inositovora NRRL Y-12698 TaxID=984486 RepID=A0A1E3QTP3_9ASCO|nr:uncharacterized protein BABINDRAFT_131611 [Babjeviella inositovora NRRL Y-12698]ODQ80297.1 hypothetical protein BABINDRAFT_131611 [Babjeviella inositovora NRRL Y-12698]